MFRKLPVLIAVASALAFGLAACGGSDDSSSSTAASTPSTSTESSTEASTTASGGGGGGGASSTVDLSETEYKITPSDPSVKSGTVTFDVKNTGTVPHNIEIEGNGIEEQGTDTITPGSTGKVTVDLKPGTYEMYCSIDGHRDLGMEGEITVQ